MQKSVKAKPESYSILFLAAVVFHIFAEIFVSTINTKISIPLAPQLIISEMIILVPGLIFILIHNSSFAEDLGFKKIKVSTVFMSILLIELLSPLISFINILSQFYAENAVLDMSGDIIDGNFFVMTFIVGIFGPLCEELVFRGIIARGMGRYGSIIGSAIMSGFLFGLLHLNFNQFCYAFVLGIIFAVLNSAAGSIWPSIIMHIVVNTKNVLLVYGLSFVYDVAGMDMVKTAQEVANGDIMMYMVGIYLILALIFTAVSIPVFAFIAKNEGNPDVYMHLKEKASKTRKWWINAYSIIGMVICLTIIFGYDAIVKLLGYN